MEIALKSAYAHSHQTGLNDRYRLYFLPLPSN